VNLKKYNLAELLFDKVLRMNAKDKDSLIGKGLIMINYGDFEKAKQYFDIVFSIDPNNEYALRFKS
jgi:lipoprotein NlpI